MSTQDKKGRGRFKDLTGEVLDDLTILKMKGFEKHSETFPDRNVSVWDCMCLCGNICEKRSTELTKSRGYKSCGCKRSSGKAKVGHYKIEGVGTNDLQGVSGDIYDRWCNMLRRCYDEKSFITNPTYKDCTVCDEWKTFSNFKIWIEKQDYQGKDLDKDLLVFNNKVYSPDTCILVPPTVNAFLLRGALKDNLIGAAPCDIRGKLRYKTRVHNPVSGEREYLGIFHTEIEAHEKWLTRKKEIAVLIGQYYKNSYYTEILLLNLKRMYEE